MKALLGLILWCALPFAAAHWFWMYPVGRVQTKTLVGTLALPGLQIGKPSRYWRLVYRPLPGQTKSQQKWAQRKLSSIYKAFNKHISRVELMWTGPEEKNAWPSIALNASANHIPQQAVFLLIDPMGNLVLSYSINAEAYAILRECLHILKHSKLGRVR